VNIGSGVSILRVDGPDSFHRISGTSLGGGTFWGLTRLLTDITSFDDIKDLDGDNKNVDLIVGDIYGGSYSNFNLDSNLIASRFARVVVRCAAHALMRVQLRQSRNVEAQTRRCGIPLQKRRHREELAVHAVHQYRANLILECEIAQHRTNLVHGKFHGCESIHTYSS
jgi:pantothenate kinase